MLYSDRKVFTSIRCMNSQRGCCQDRIGRGKYKQHNHLIKREKKSKNDKTTTSLDETPTSHLLPQILQAPKANENPITCMHSREGRLLPRSNKKREIQTTQPHEGKKMKFQHLHHICCHRFFKNPKQ